MPHETPSGTVDGVNATFTTVFNISNEQLFVDRLLQFGGTDYTLSGNIITFTNTAIPQPGAIITIWYLQLPGAAGSSSGLTSLSSIRAAAADRADMPTPSSGTFESLVNWNALINESYRELYGILAQAFGNDYEVQTPYSITTDGVNYLYGLPSDFFKLLGMDLLLGGKYTTLKTFTFQERNRGSIVNNIPTAGLVLQMWYVPRVTTLVNDSDTLDGVNGWEEYIITDAAIKAMQKEESDVSVLMAQKQALKERIQEEADRRDAANPACVADSQRANAEWPALFYGVTNLRYRLSGGNIWLKPDDSFLYSADWR